MVDLYDDRFKATASRARVVHFWLEFKSTSVVETVVRFVDLQS